MNVLVVGASRGTGRLTALEAWKRGHSVAGFARLTRESGLDWIIVRPSGLTNGPARGRYRIETEIRPVPGRISRADVAAFMVDAVERDTWLGQAVLLGG